MPGREGIEWAPSGSCSPTTSSVRPQRWGRVKLGLRGNAWWLQWLRHQSPEGIRKPSAGSLAPSPQAEWWHPARLFQACGQVSGPRLSQFLPTARRTKRESLHQHQVSAAALRPARPDWISNWITVPAPESVRGSGTQSCLFLTL